MDKCAAVLPGLCTDIVNQKKRSGRVSVYIDGVYFDGFSREVIHKNHIQKGDTITADLYKQLVHDEYHFKLREQIFRWLSFRDHSVGEITSKSLAKGYSKEVIDHCINYFLDKGLLDDAAFARQFAASKAAASCWGPLKIRAALSQKGIKKHYIDAELNDLFPNNSSFNDLLAAARGIKNRLMRTDPGSKRKKKLANFLVRRGFSGHLVLEHIEGVLNNLENEET
ncbi:MAG: regulatory protein RecX [Balneolales bacterium]